MLWSLFITFLKIGFVSFGGGYAMIPVIEREVSSRGWMDSAQFIDAVAIAGMSPGPIATNCATLIGYRIAGLPGAIASTLGMIVPSLIVIVLLAAFFYKVHQHRTVQAVFYGLRPVVTGLIAFAAIRYAMNSSSGHTEVWEIVVTLALVVVFVIGILRYKMHPLVIICISGLLGIAIFQ
ncbi:chromate transporter [Paenibacillus thalictri]|uniref:Chromate transporter n=1 Tax=Paenibacillus thalictri TaxID=2527873 RepID=A0A4Q9DNR8_9BACL|nr:chromate transporter [Paenibacillus thalictri]TBL75605.1 chromate transporter [Paenibacillus thalictri]